jgi:hypothetical protein
VVQASLDGFFRRFPQRRPRAETRPMDSRVPRLAGPRLKTRDFRVVRGPRFLGPTDAVCPRHRGRGSFPFPPRRRRGLCSESRSIETRSRGHASRVHVMRLASEGVRI